MHFQALTCAWLLTAIARGVGAQSEDRSGALAALSSQYSAFQSSVTKSPLYNSLATYFKTVDVESQLAAVSADPVAFLSVYKSQFETESWYPAVVSFEKSLAGVVASYSKEADSLLATEVPATTTTSSQSTVTSGLTSTSTMQATTASSTTVSATSSTDSSSIGSSSATTTTPLTPSTSSSSTSTAATTTTATQSSPPATSSAAAISAKRGSFQAAVGALVAGAIGLVVI